MKKSFVTAILFTIFLSASVLAPPALPQQFWGTVTVNGNPAPDGTTVTAKVDGEAVKSADTMDGEYSLVVQDQSPGETVHFFVEGTDTEETGTVLEGGVERIDFSVALDEDPGGGGGSGGSSSDDETTTTIAQEEEEQEEQEEEECREKWTCTEWSPCVDGRQTRTCTEENGCGTDLYRPFETQPCVSEEGGQAQGSDFSATGRFLTSPVGMGALAVVMALAGAVFFWKRKGLGTKKTKE